MIYPANWKLFIPISYRRDDEWQPFSDEAVLIYAVIALYNTLYKETEYCRTIHNWYADLFKNTKFTKTYTDKIKKGIIELTDANPRWGYSLNAQQTEWAIDGREIYRFQEDIFYVYIYANDFESFLMNEQSNWFGNFAMYCRILETFTKQYNEMFGEDEKANGILGKHAERSIAAFLKCSSQTIHNKINHFIDMNMLTKYKRHAYIADGQYVQPPNFLCRYGDREVVRSAVNG